MGNLLWRLHVKKGYKLVRSCFCKSLSNTSGWYRVLTCEMIFSCVCSCQAGAQHNFRFFKKSKWWMMEFNGECGYLILLGGWWSQVTFPCKGEIRFVTTERAEVGSFGKGICTFFVTVTSDICNLTLTHNYIIISFTPVYFCFVPYFLLLSQF